VRYQGINETYVVLPAELAERDRVGILVEDEGQRDGEVEDVEALGAECVRQDLDRVGNDERRVRDAVDMISIRSPNG
jgi:hypothetical protein